MLKRTIAHPQFDSVAHPIWELVELTVSRLTEMTEQKLQQTPRQIILRPYIIERGSVKKLRPKPKERE